MVLHQALECFSMLDGDARLVLSRVLTALGAYFWKMRPSLFKLISSFS